jgi:hypothetical protein
MLCVNEIVVLKGVECDRKYCGGCVRLKQMLHVNICILSANWWHRFSPSHVNFTFFFVLKIKM